MYSCVKPSRVLPNTITSTTAASTHSAASKEIRQASIKINTSGLLNWLTSKPRAVACCKVLSALGPSFARRKRASPGDRPCA